VDNERLSIGEFARRARLTPKALRIYDNSAPLADSHDPHRYRRYRRGPEPGRHRAHLDDIAVTSTLRSDASTRPL